MPSWHAISLLSSQSPKHRSSNIMEFKSLKWYLKAVTRRQNKRSCLWIRKIASRIFMFSWIIVDSNI